MFQYLADPLQAMQKILLQCHSVSTRNGLAILFGKQYVQTLQTQALLISNKIAYFQTSIYCVVHFGLTYLRNLVTVTTLEY